MAEMAVNVNIFEWISEHHKQLLADDPETWENARTVLVMAQIEQTKKSDDYYKKYDNAQLDDLIDDAFRVWKIRFLNDDYAPAQKASLFTLICNRKLRSYHRAKTISDEESGERIPREIEIDPTEQFEEMVNKEIQGKGEKISSQIIQENCHNINTKYCETIGDKLSRMLRTMLEIMASGSHYFPAVCFCILNCLGDEEYIAEKQKETKRRNPSMRVKQIVEKCAQHDQSLKVENFHDRRKDCLETFLEVFGYKGIKEEFDLLSDKIDKRYISLR